mmetsp:Transcript_28298/g.84452  ORF Transcript_28298/g.84452 Transcript_28298/m.84452 type:complete len:251 (-) Transcript_28298:621-1373(-)
MATASRASASGPKRNCRARIQRVRRPVQMRAAASRRLKQQYAEVRASRQKTRCCSIASVKTTSPRASFHSRIMSRSHSSFMHGMWPEVVPVDASLALIAPCTTFAAPTTVSSPHLSGRAKSSARACFLRHTAADAASACAAAIAASSSSFSAADCSCSCSGKPAAASALRRTTSALAAASRASFLRSPSALNAASFRAWIAPRVRFLPSSIPSTTALAAATAAAASGAVLAAAIAGGNQQHLAGGGDLYR